MPSLRASGPATLPLFVALTEAEVGLDAVPTAVDDGKSDDVSALAAITAA